MSDPGPVVDIVLSVLDGARYLEEQIRSIQAQTHEQWRLWVRDDGSRDGSWDVAATMAATDSRIHVHPRDGERMGSGPAFGWLMERLPSDGAPVFCCDADDVWLPEKIQRSLEALTAAEARRPGPILVHTDLVVTDGALEPLAPSLWDHLGLEITGASLPELAVANPVTGPTMLLNRALVEQVLPIPEEAVHQDWWIALVAAVVGETVAVPFPSVLHRRHSANTTGELGGRRLGGVRGALGRAMTAGSRSARIKAWVRDTGRQADALLRRFGPHISAQDRRALEDIASAATSGWATRKWRIWRYYGIPGRGWLRGLGLVLRG